jgi:hypothetical protein
MSATRLHPGLRVVWPALLALVLSSCGDDKGTNTDNHDHDHDHDTTVTGHCGHIDAEGFVLEEHGTVFCQSWQGIQSGAIEVIEGTRLPHIQLVFLDPDSLRYMIADTCSLNSLTWTIEDPSVIDVVRDPGFEWTFHIDGKVQGTTNLMLTIWHEDHVFSVTDPIPVHVTPDTRPRYALTGRVRLLARLTTDLGIETGIRTVDDADGVEVVLQAPDNTTWTTTTVDGEYRFEGLLPTAYKARTQLTPETTTETPYIVVISGDMAASDTLVVPSAGDMKTYPNPFPAEHGEAIEFTTTTPDPYTIDVYTLGWEKVYTHTTPQSPGFQHFHWAGFDTGGAPVPAGPYWIVLHRDGTVHTSLVFKEGP